MGACLGADLGYGFRAQGSGIKDQGSRIKDQGSRIQDFRIQDLRFLRSMASALMMAATTDETGRRIAACQPMHTFGHPARIDEIAAICDEWGIALVEDAAESLGSYYKDRHTGTFGRVGVFSFNGNKIITTGGGGMIVTDDEELAQRAKHLTTTAKVPHPYEYVHDELGYNFRMPNLNAALGCAQMDQLTGFLESSANCRTLCRFLR